MSLLNRVMMIGNLAGDPVVRRTAGGTAVADICIAMDARERSARSKEGTSGGAATETTFVDVVLWERMAENAEQFLRKGSGVLVEGRLQQDSWVDKNTGQTRRKLRVVGERLRFVGGSGNPVKGPEGQEVVTARASP